MSTSCGQLGLSPPRLVEWVAASSAPPWLCPSPRGLSLFLPCSFPGDTRQGWEPVSLSSFESALLTSAWALVLSSGPSSPNVPIARALPLSTQCPWEPSLKPVPKDGHLQGAGDQRQATHCQPCPLRHGHENKPKPSLSVDDALL